MLRSVRLSNMQYYDKTDIGLNIYTVQQKLLGPPETPELYTRLKEQKSTTG